MRARRACKTGEAAAAAQVMTPLAFSGEEERRASAIDVGHTCTCPGWVEKSCLDGTGGDGIGTGGDGDGIGTGEDGSVGPCCGGRMGGTFSCSCRAGSSFGIVSYLGSYLLRKVAWRGEYPLRMEGMWRAERDLDAGVGPGCDIQTRSVVTQAYK